MTIYWRFYKKQFPIIMLEYHLEKISSLRYKGLFTNYGEGVGAPKREGGPEKVLVMLKRGPGAPTVLGYRPSSF